MRIANILTASTLVLLCLISIRGDLPVHCEMGSVVGEWTFWTSQPNDYTLVPKLPIKMDGAKFCLSHTGSPTMNSDLMREARNPPNPTIGFSNSFTVGLSLTQSVHQRSDSGEFDSHALLALEAEVKGRWSMIFDEGLEVRIGNRNYFAISRYTCSKNSPDAWCTSDSDAHENSDGSVSGWETHCDQTFMGWYHDTDADSGEVTGLGCWFGKRNPGPSPAYLNKPLSLSFAQEKRRFRSNEKSLGTDVVPNSCDIDEGVEKIVDASLLPKNFSWRDQYKNFQWDTPITVQGDCGSCYAVAAVYALQARANLLLAKEGIKTRIKLSTQSVVSCSWYNQGCDGGLEMLVHRHAQEAGIPPESCMEYTSGKSGKSGKCEASCYSDESELVFAKDYGYVGGFNGQCSEARLLRNLYEYGPLTIAVNVANARVGSLDGMPGAQAPGRGDTDTLAVKLKGTGISEALQDLATDPSVYKFLSSHPGEASSDDTYGFLFVRASVVNKDLAALAGVLSASLKARGHVGINMTDAFTLGIHGWEYIDHSIVLIGYGINKDNGSKFWSIRNSWGGYSEYGAFTNLDRGDDIAAIESGAVWVQPDPCRGKLAKILKQNGKFQKYCSS